MRSLTQPSLVRVSLEGQAQIVRLHTECNCEWNGRMLNNECDLSTLLYGSSTTFMGLELQGLQTTSPESRGVLVQGRDFLMHFQHL